jgi:chorismate--pyruvate lyase
MKNVTPSKYRSPGPLTAYSWSDRPLLLASAEQRAWLARPGALTAGLRQWGALSLSVVFEGSNSPAPDEVQALEVKPRTRIWIREVSMSLDGVPCVIARSVTRLPDSRTIWRGIRNLASRPLADLLYDDRTIRRGSFQASRASERQGIWLAVKHAGHDKTMPLLARRSVFTRHQKQLLVTECFLPAFWDLLRTAKHLDPVLSHDLRRA